MISGNICKIKMSYLVLSLKYRPKSFQAVVGQDHVTQTLTNAFKKERISQAYLFTGPRGVGKTTTARLVAKALNCLNSPGAPCNNCSNCHEITEGRNMDVFEIDGASNRGIDEIRDLREAIQYAPLNSKYKIFIIDEVHMLTKPAFNALLRTLEEPPEHGKFILATTDIFKVPDTIISRCQRFDFNSMSIATISDQIKYVLERENIKIDEESARIIAQKADGSMRDALSILDQVISFSDKDITIESLNQVLGLIPTEIYFNIFNAIKTKNGKELVHILDEIKSKGMALPDFMAGLIRHIRNMLIASVQGGLDSIEMNLDLKKKYIGSAKLWNSKDLLRISNVITEVEPLLKNATQPHILLELSLLKLLELDTTVVIEEMIAAYQKSPIIPDFKKPAQMELNTNPPLESKNIAELPKQEKVAATKSTKADKQISEPKQEINSYSKPITIDEIKENWSKFLSDLSSERPTIGTVLAQSEIGNLTGNRLELKISGNNFNLRTLEKNKLIIEKFLTKNYKTQLKPVFLMVKSKRPEAIPKMANKDENQMSAKIIELFDGEILN